jgi:hypothetical protein
MTAFIAAPRNHPDVLEKPFNRTMPSGTADGHGAAVGAFAHNTIPSNSFGEGQRGFNAPKVARSVYFYESRAGTFGK